MAFRPGIRKLQLGTHGTHTQTLCNRERMIKKRQLAETGFEKVCGRFLAAAFVLYALVAWTYFRGFKYLNSGNDATFSSQGGGKSGAQMEGIVAWIFLFFLLFLGVSISIYAARISESNRIRAIALLSVGLPIVFLLWLLL